MVALKNISTATHTENVDMVQLARRNRKDTMSLRTLTHITIVYLPASLIAVSSGIVHQDRLLIETTADYFKL